MTSEGAKICENLRADVPSSSAAPWPQRMRRRRSRGRGAGPLCALALPLPRGRPAARQRVGDRLAARGDRATRRADGVGDVVGVCVVIVAVRLYFIMSCYGRPKCAKICVPDEHSRVSKFVENLRRQAEICTKKFARFEKKSWAGSTRAPVCIALCKMATS